MNGSTYYDTAVTAVLGAAGNFRMSGEVGAVYARLKSSANVTATATICGKS